MAQTLAKSNGVTISWTDWFLGALVPGLVSLIVVPWLIYKLYPPEIKATPNAKAWAKDQLAQMGPISLPEKIMAVIFVCTLILWITGSFLDIDATLAALLLAYFGNLMSSTTHYASGPAPVLFWSGYVPQNKWWSLNFILGIFYLVVWIGLGSIWLKVLGMW